MRSASGGTDEVPVLFHLFIVKSDSESGAGGNSNDAVLSKNSIEL